MMARKFTDAQKGFILKQWKEGMPIAEAYRQAGINLATFFNWRTKYDGLLPRDDAYIEALMGWFPTECLNIHWFLTLGHAREKVEAWLRYYNPDRPHRAIGYNALPDLIKSCGVAGTPSR